MEVHALDTTRVILAVGGHIPLGYGDYVLAINWAHGNNPSLPLLNPIMGVLSAEEQTAAHLEQRFGANEFDAEGRLSFEVPKSKVSTVRQWFIAGHDRSRDPFRAIVQATLPEVEFEAIELIGLTRDTLYDAGQKVVILVDTYVAWPSEYGKQTIEALLTHGHSRIARATEGEITMGQLTFGGAINTLARQMLRPAFLYANS